MRFWPSKADMLANFTKIQTFVFISRSFGLVKVIEYPTMKGVGKVTSGEVETKSVLLSKSIQYQER